MRKFKSKSLVIIFLILLIFQFLILLTKIMFIDNGTGLATVVDNLIKIMSLPISLVNENLPFYVREHMVIKILFWVINILLQSIFIYFGLRVFKRLRRKVKEMKTA